MIKNLHSNAGETGSILGWGTKIPQAMEQLSPSIATKTQVNDSHSVMSNSL